MDLDIGLLGLAIGLGIALAAMFGALGQARAISSAVESIARQPEAGGRIFTVLIIGLALIETLVIYTLVVTGFMLAPKLDNIITAKYGVSKIKAVEAQDAYDKAKEPTH